MGADEFSTNKWQAGPGTVYINKTNKWGIWGVLAYQQWSFAGKDSAQSVSVLTGQPVLVVHKSWGYWGWTDQTITLRLEEQSECCSAWTALWQCHQIIRQKGDQDGAWVLLHVAQQGQGQYVWPQVPVHTNFRGIVETLIRFGETGFSCISGVI